MKPLSLWLDQGHDNTLRKNHYLIDESIIEEKRKSSTHFYLFKMRKKEMTDGMCAGLIILCSPFVITARKINSF